LYPKITGLGAASQAINAEIRSIARTQLNEVLEAILQFVIKIYDL
jgi:hypothetical protein